MFYIWSEETRHNNRHNIASFLQWCKTYGLERDWLFSVRDLADREDGRRVLSCLLWVGRLAHKRGVPAPQIPKIEEKCGMRYYTFMARLIVEPPLPVHALFAQPNDIVRGKVLSTDQLTGLFNLSWFVELRVAIAAISVTMVKRVTVTMVIGDMFYYMVIVMRVTMVIHVTLTLTVVFTSIYLAREQGVSNLVFRTEL